MKQGRAFFLTMPVVYLSEPKTIRKPGALMALPFQRQQDPTVALGFEAGQLSDKAAE
jgi:hypothetical protein